MISGTGKHFIFSLNQYGHRCLTAMAVL